MELYFLQKGDPDQSVESLISRKTSAQECGKLILDTIDIKNL